MNFIVKSQMHCNDDHDNDNDKRQRMMMMLFISLCVFRSFCPVHAVKSSKLCASIFVPFITTIIKQTANLCYYSTASVDYDSLG